MAARSRRCRSRSGGLAITSKTPRRSEPYLLTITGAPSASPWHFHITTARLYLSPAPLKSTSANAGPPPQAKIPGGNFAALKPPAFATAEPRFDAAVEALHRAVGRAIVCIAFIVPVLVPGRARGSPAPRSSDCEALNTPAIEVHRGSCARAKKVRKPAPLAPISTTPGAAARP